MSEQGKSYNYGLDQQAFTALSDALGLENARSALLRERMFPTVRDLPPDKAAQRGTLLLIAEQIIVAARNTKMDSALRLWNDFQKASPPSSG